MGGRRSAPLPPPPPLPLLLLLLLPPASPRVAIGGHLGCSEPEDSFVIVQNFPFSLTNLSTTTHFLMDDVRSIERCISSCVGVSNCRSVLFYPGRCYMFPFRDLGNRESRVSEQVPSTYAYKVCVRKREECLRSTWIFEEVPSSRMLPPDSTWRRQVNVTDTIEDCMSQCLEKGSFLCRSVNYDEDSQICEMNPFDRHSLEPAAARRSLQFVSRSWSYLESGCSVRGWSSHQCGFAPVTSLVPRSVDVIVDYTDGVQSCHQFCRNSVAFRCRMFEFNATGLGECRLTHHSPSSLIVAGHAFHGGSAARSYEPNSCFLVRGDCDSDGLEVVATTDELFTGRMSADSGPGLCFVDTIHNHTLHLRLDYTNSECPFRRIEEDFFEVTVTVQAVEMGKARELFRILLHCPDRLKGHRAAVVLIEDLGGMYSKEAERNLKGAVPKKEDDRIRIPTVPDLKEALMGYWYPFLRDQEHRVRNESGDEDKLLWEGGGVRWFGAIEERPPCKKETGPREGEGEMKLVVTDTLGCAVNSSKLMEILLLKFIIRDMSPFQSMAVTNLFAFDPEDNSTALLIDSHGCVADKRVLSPITKISKNEWVTTLQAFAFSRFSEVKFSARVFLCEQEFCYPTCQSAVTDGSRNQESNYRETDPLELLLRQPDEQLEPHVLSRIEEARRNSGSRQDFDQTNSMRVVGSE